MNEYELYHHGILGMKWGVRRYQNADGSLTAAGRKRYLNSDGTLTKAGEKEVKKFKAKVNRSWYKSYNKATAEFNRDIQVINKKYEGVTFDEAFSTPKGKRYLKEVNDMWQKHYADALISDFGKEPITNGQDWVKNAPLMNSYMR